MVYEFWRGYQPRRRLMVVDVAEEGCGVEEVAIKKIDKDAIARCPANHTSILVHLSNSCLGDGPRKLPVYTSVSRPGVSL